MDANTAFTLLLIFPMISSAVIYLVGRVFSRNVMNEKRTNPAGWLALIALLGTGVFLYFVITNVFSTGQSHYQSFGEVWFRFDGISMMLSLLVLVLGILVTVYSFTYMGKESGEEKFYALLVIMIGAQSFINIGSMIGLVPMTGVPLVFVSHGGTALLFALIAVGIILNVSRSRV